MPTKREGASREPRVRLVRDGDGWRVVRTEYRFRFLLSDGRVVEVVTHSDDSDVRGAVLDVTKAERIEGVARLPLDPPLPSPEETAEELGRLLPDVEVEP